jgi:hypothetical protein
MANSKRRIFVRPAGRAVTNYAASQKTTAAIPVMSFRHAYNTLSNSWVSRLWRLANELERNNIASLFHAWR